LKLIVIDTSAFYRTRDICTSKYICSRQVQEELFHEIGHCGISSYLISQKEINNFKKEYSKYSDIGFLSDADISSLILSQKLNLKLYSKDKFQQNMALKLHISLHHPTITKIKSFNSFCRICKISLPRKNNKCLKCGK